LKNAESIETIQNNLEKCYSNLAVLVSFLLGAGILTAKKRLSLLVEAAKQMTTTTSQLHEAVQGVTVKGKGKGKGPPGPAPPRSQGKGAKLGASEIPLLAGKVNQNAPGHPHQPVGEISPRSDPDTLSASSITSASPGHPHRPVGEISPRSDPDTLSASSITSASPGVQFTRTENLMLKLKQAIQKVAQLQEKIKKGEGDHNTRSQIEIHDAEIAKYKLLIPRIILNVNVPIWQLLYTRACKYPREQDKLFSSMSTVLVKLCNGDLENLAMRYQANRKNFYKDQGMKFAPEDSTMEIATLPELNADVSSKLNQYLHHGLVQGMTEIIKTFASSSGYSTREVSDYAASVQIICSNTLVKLYDLFQFADKELIVNKLKLAFKQHFLWDNISETFEENENQDDIHLGIGGEDRLVCTRLVKDRMRNIGGSQDQKYVKDFIFEKGRPLMLINLAGAGSPGVDFWNKLIGETLERDTVMSAPKKTDKRNKDNKQPSYCILFGKSPQCKDLPEEKEGVAPPYRAVTSQNTTPLMCMMGLLSYIRKCWSESSGDFKTNPSGISANWCSKLKDPLDKTCKNIPKIIKLATRHLEKGSISSLTEQQAKAGATSWNAILTHIIEKYDAKPQIKDDFKIASALYTNDNMNIVEARIEQGFTAAKDYNDVFEQIIHKKVGSHKEIEPARISESYSAIVDCLFLLQELVDFLQPQCGRTTNIKKSHVLRAPSHSPDVNKRSSTLLAANHEKTIEEFKHKHQRDPTPQETEKLLKVDSFKKAQRARSANRIPRDSFHLADFRKEKKDHSILAGARLRKHTGQSQITESESTSLFARPTLKKVVNEAKSEQTKKTEDNSLLASARSKLKPIDKKN